MLTHMKRTSLLLDESLVKEIKRLAREQSTTMTEVLQSLLREGLRVCGQAKKKGYKLDLPVVKGKLREGVNIADRKSLYDLMENIS